jgi:hypothetical protein
MATTHHLLIDPAFGDMTLRVGVDVELMNLVTAPSVRWHPGGWAVTPRAVTRRRVHHLARADALGRSLGDR